LISYLLSSTKEVLPMSTYHQLTLEERYHIYGLKRAGYSITTIADELKRHNRPLAVNSQILNPVVGDRCLHIHKPSKDGQVKQKKNIS